ncbi:MAG TPA: ABC transporter permease [Thermoanaerobaculia bacterium]|nr:ABC transporter permease [Thermoanaerobaculia bacterium]
MRQRLGIAVVAGSLFTPVIVAIVRLINHRGLPAIYAADAFWPNMWRSCWESMAIFFLPLGAILATSLITQLEFKSNAWKQVHTLPVSTAVIFLSKLAVILVMMVLFLLLFNAGIWVSAMIPYVVVPGVPHPKGSFLSLPLLRENALYFIHCLPIVAAQYLMSLRSSNFLVPIGIGFMAWVGALAAVSSKFAIWWPYGYTIIHYLKDRPKGARFAAYANLHWLSLLVFVLLTIVSYVLFITKKERG